MKAKEDSLQWLLPALEVFSRPHLEPVLYRHCTPSGYEFYVTAEQACAEALALLERPKLDG